MQDELHADLTIMLERARATSDATECHAILTGLACGMDESELAGTAAQALCEVDPAIGDDDELIGRLGSLAVRVRDSLESDDMHFSILVPEDQPLSARALALASWCQGFLYGLGVAQVDLDMLDDEAAEAVEDFAGIARAVRGTEDSETVEEAYAQLFEFIRVGVHLVHQSIRQQQEDDDEHRQEHRE